MRPFGNSSTASSGTSMRAEAGALDGRLASALLLSALPEEVQERLLNDVAAGLQGRLVDRTAASSSPRTSCAMSASSTSESIFVSDPSTSCRRLSADSRRLVVAPTVARAWLIASRFVVEALEVGRAQRVHVGRGAALQVLRDVAQDVQELAVGGALSLAEQVGADARSPGRTPLARSHAPRSPALPGVGVARRSRVRAHVGRGAGEDVAAAVGGVGLLLDGCDQLVDLRGRGRAGRLAGRVRGSLHRELLRAVHGRR